MSIIIPSEKNRKCFLYNPSGFRAPCFYDEKDKKQIYFMRPSGLVSGNLLDRFKITAAASDEAHGPFLHLDVPDLRHGLSACASLQTSPREKYLVSRLCLYRRYFSDGVCEREPPEKAGRMSQGLQPRKKECERRHKA